MTVPTGTLLRVEVVQVASGGVKNWQLALEAPATVADALGRISADPPVLAGPQGSPGVGIFGQIVTLDTPLEDGDRIEIYRGPAVDPKAARRARARRGS